jgi:hypothetical protein
MSFLKVFSLTAGILLAFSVGLYFIIAVNVFILANLTGYLHGLAFAVWNPLWIALVVALWVSWPRDEDEDKPEEELTDEERHWREYDH